MPYMVKAKSGVIVTLGSVTGFECDGNSTYGITKAGLDRLALTLAKAGAPHGVRAFCVAPGPVLTRPAMAKTHVIDAGRLALPRGSNAGFLQDGSGKNYKK